MHAIKVSKGRKRRLAHITPCKTNGELMAALQRVPGGIYERERRAFVATGSLEATDRDAGRLARAAAKRERKAARHARPPLSAISIDEIADMGLRRSHYDHNTHQMLRY